MSRYADYLIEEFFNSPKDFIMYTGGSGGEHLVVKLKQYSNKYRDNSIQFDTSQLVNRWHIIGNPFILTVGSEYSARWKSPHIRGWSVKEYSRLLIESMMRNYDYTSICRILEKTISDEMELETTPLYRKHVSGYSVFNNSNTILIDAYDPIWTDYSRLLFGYKTLGRVYPIPELVNRLKKIPFYMHSRKDALIKYVLDNYMNTLNSGVVVNEAKIALICSTDRYTIEGILSLDPSEAIMQYVKENMDIRTKLKDLAEMNTERRISMNRMFDKGYMEDMFEIDSPQFNEDMIIWHEKNLELLSSYGHNVEEWKLKR